MAEERQKTQAQKAASSRQQPKKGTKSGSSKKTDSAKNAPPQTRIPIRLITSAICLALFVIFLVMFLNPEGSLVIFFQQFIMGLIGRVSFYVSIPALLYLFVIQAFSGKRPVFVRSICLIAFVLICGCISQLSMNSDNLPSGFALLAELFQGGSTGKTAGLLCGGIALILKALCGTAISMIIMIVGAALTHRRPFYPSSSGT